MKPKGIVLFLLICWNWLNDLIPNIIGIIAAWKCANNKIEKNKINSQTQLILNLNTKLVQVIWGEKYTIDQLL